ncbi:MAG: translation elongation factor Ts [Gemmatimonadota bacterium]
MAEITAVAVKALRDRTGAGMMDCKKALAEAAGDEERAIDLLRQRGAAKAAKRAGREATEGAVQIATGEGVAGMAEAASETDFVARSDAFVAFTRRVAEAVMASELASGRVTTGKEFLAGPESASLRAELEDLRTQVGENVGLSRVVRMAADGGSVGSYLHFGNRIGVLLRVEGEGGEEVARQLAMHVAAAAPVAVSPEEIPEELRERERSVLTEQARGEGKPPQIVEKIVEGRMRKFYEENALLSQGFVKDPEKRVADLLAEAGENLRVRGFARFHVGG